MNRDPGAQIAMDCLSSHERGVNRTEELEREIEQRYTELKQSCATLDGATAFVRDYCTDPDFLAAVSLILFATGSHNAVMENELRKSARWMVEHGK